MFTKSEVAIRKAQLIKAGENLKKHFVGIDNVIDDIINKIEIWWCYPDFLTRPTVINLYSLTGSGKTDLIRRLAMELELQDKFCNIELDNNKSENPYTGWSDSSIISKLFDARIRTSDQSITLLDEIQRHRTIVGGNYIGSKMFNDMWKLLSDGRLTNNQERIKWFKETINRLNEQSAASMMNSIQQNKNAIFENAECYKDASTMMQPQSTTNPNDRGNGINTDRLLNYICFTNEDADFIWNMKMMMQSTEKVFMDKITIDQNKYMRATRLLDSISNQMIVKFIERKFDEIISKTISEDDDDEYVYSKMLIFISGNIDNLFVKNNTSSVVNDFETLRKHTESITIDDVKKELLTMFRPEQVSRFGNNYIIYPSLTKDDYKEIVKRDVDVTLNKLNRKYNTNININYDEIWNKVREVGIYPDQGVRPVFSTVASVMGDIIPNILIKLIND